VKPSRISDPDPQDSVRAPDQAPHVVLPWLVRLRWMSLVALAAGVWAGSTFWRVALPIRPLLLLLTALAATNAALSFQLRSPVPRRDFVGLVLLVDVMLLTGILYLAGGPLNPFSIVFLVGITIAAASLGHQWAIIIALASNIGYLLTFQWHRPLIFTDPAFSDRVLTLHTSGMWVAFAAATALIAHFVARVSESLAQREHELTEVRAAAARSERMAALLSLGAGAAHELATPLSTISTAAAELDRSIRSHPGADPVATEYAAIIRDEIDRCTNILDQLSGRAASTSAADTAIAVTRLVEDLRYRLGDALASRLDVSLPDDPRPVIAPAEPLRQALVALLRNAFDASAPDQRVTLEVDQRNGLRMSVIDRGRGMSEREASQAGDPFFTTKPSGAGLGLGLFLVRAFAAQMGGTLRLQTRPGEGTAAVLDLPAR